MDEITDIQNRIQQLQLERERYLLTISQYKILADSAKLEQLKLQTQLQAMRVDRLAAAMNPD